jgi:hypothetical protein
MGAAATTFGWMDTLSAGGFENLHFQIVPLKLAETVLL